MWSRYRQTEKNIGVAPWQIAGSVLNLVADTRVRIADATTSRWPIDDISVRFHHRLVSIHPFPNGNGRHSRAATDLLLIARNGTPFTWGRQNLNDAGEVRSRYIAALRSADAHDLGPLRAFVRS